MTDLDDAIRLALAEIVAASPAPPAADDLRTAEGRPHDRRPGRRRALLLTAGGAAAAAVVVGVTVVAVTGDDEVAVRTDATATTAVPTGVEPTTAPTPTGVSTTTSPTASAEVAALLARPVVLPSTDSATRCPVTAPTTDAIPDLANVVGEGTGRAAGIVGGAVSVGDPGNGEWWAGKVLFAVDPSVEGPVVVRGGLVGGSGGLGFGPSPAPVEPQFVIPALSEPGTGATEATLPGAWRAEPAEVRVSMPGCYAVQIDTATSSDVIVFRATPIVPDGPVERATLDPLPDGRHRRDARGPARDGPHRHVLLDRAGTALRARRRVRRGWRVELLDPTRWQFDDRQLDHRRPDDRLPAEHRLGLPARGRRGGRVDRAPDRSARRSRHLSAASSRSRSGHRPAPPASSSTSRRVRPTGQWSKSSTER